MNTIDLLCYIAEGVAAVGLLIMIPYVAHLLTPPAEPKADEHK